MTISDLIKAACKTKGVPEKYAERIQKTFKIEKSEGMEAFVDLFKENLFPAIQEAENEAKKAAEETAISAYEEKQKLKDGKPVEKQKDKSTADDDLLKGLSPEVKAYLEGLKKTVEDAVGKVDSTVTSTANEAKKDVARKQLKDAGLPETWIGRVDVLSKISIEDQVKGLLDELPPIVIVVKNDNGVYCALKTARVFEAVAEDAVGIKVTKNHLFTVGDFVTVGGDLQGASDAIIAIDKSNKDYDLITLNATIGAAEKDAVLVAAKDKQDAGKAALPYAGEAVLTMSKVNLTVANQQCGLLIRGTVNQACMPFPIDKGLKVLMPFIRFV